MDKEEIENLLLIWLEELKVLKETGKETEAAHYSQTAIKLLQNIDNCYKTLGKIERSNEHPLFNQLTTYIEKIVKDCITPWIKNCVLIINSFTEKPEDLATTLMGNLEDSIDSES